MLSGDPANLDAVEKALGRLEVDLVRTTDVPTEPDPQTVGIVLVAPLAGRRSLSRGVATIRESLGGERVPLFAVLDDGPSDRAVRDLYAAGATAVFRWPAEALMLPRLVAELLGVALVRGRAKGPRRALGRTVSAHLRLIPWATSDVRASAEEAGQVRLSGSVASFRRKLELERLLARVPGVTRIVSHELRVEPGRHSDRQVSRAIRATLRAATDLDTSALTIAVRAGAVTLAGTVADRQELRRIVELVTHVTGVRDLANHLVVGGTGRRQDGAAARRLNGALAKWFPKDRVRVNVWAGVAVLDGEAAGLDRRLEIGQFVEQDPAIVRVINKIETR